MEVFVLFYVISYLQIQRRPQSWIFTTNAIIPPTHTPPSSRYGIYSSRSCLLLLLLLLSARKRVDATGGG